MSRSPSGRVERWQGRGEAASRQRGTRGIELPYPPVLNKVSPRRGEGDPMPGTHSQILLHIVFSTKRREPWLAPDICERLYPYVGGIVRAEKGTLYAISR